MSRPLSVLIASTLYPPTVVGGAERSTARLAEALVANGHSVTVVTTTPNETALREHIDGVHVRRIPLGRAWPFGAERTAYQRFMWHLGDVHSSAMQSSVSEVMEDVKPDVLHTNTLSGITVSVWGAAKARGIPIVHTLRDYYLLCPRNSMFRGGSNCVPRCLECRMLSHWKTLETRHVDGVVGNSQFILDKHLDFGLFPNAAVRRVVFNAYDRPPEGEEVIEHTPLSATGHVRFGYMGRLSVAKGFPYLLDAVSKLPSSGWTLTVAGSGDDRFESTMRAMNLSNVEYLGFVDPPEFFDRIDVLVLPSLWHEPLSRVIFEAYAHGKPVIASNRGGSPEIVDVGVTGYLFDPGHGLESLTDVLARAIEHPLELRGMRPNCLVKADDFLPKSTAEAYEDTYRTCLAVDSAFGLDS